jgi:hypothetical protein
VNALSAGDWLGPLTHAPEDRRYLPLTGAVWHGYGPILAVKSGERGMGSDFGKGCLGVPTIPPEVAGPGESAGC